MLRSLNTTGPFGCPLCSARANTARLVAAIVFPITRTVPIVTPAICGGVLPVLSTMPSITFATVLPLIVTVVIDRWLRLVMPRYAPPTTLSVTVTSVMARSDIDSWIAHGAAALAAVLSPGVTSPRSMRLPATVAFSTPSRLMPRRPVEALRVWLMMFPVTVRPSTLNSTMPVSALPTMVSIRLPVIVQSSLPMPPPLPRPSRIGVSVVFWMRLLRMARSS